MITEPQSPGTIEQPDTDVEALIREARRRARRRRARAVLALALVLGLAVAGLAITHTLQNSGSATEAPQPSSVLGVPSVALKQPAALAVSRSGVLYVVDPTRDQILRRLPDGRFAVVAGNGHAGFSGDGGPATHAALRLTGASGIVVGHDGTVYFTDTGNNVVRAVRPDGRIETIAGNGERIPRDVNAPYLTGSRPALSAELQDPSSVAFGPGGKLYIAAQDVVALSRDGSISYFAGPTRPGVSQQGRLIDGTPVEITFDRAGDMFAASFPWLMERTATGRIVFLGDGFRSGGSSGSGSGILASSPNGTVFEGYGNADGIINMLVHPTTVPNGRVMSTRGLKRVISPKLLNRVLGTRGNIQNGFGPSGLAVTADGTIYTDTDHGYWSSRSALVEITPRGHVHTLWTSH